MEEKDTTKYKAFVVHTAKYRTLYTKKYEERKGWTRPDPKKLYSYMPGTVISINVEKGQKVDKGDSLMVLEAMKMQNKIEVPFDGVVKDIKVEEGQKIPCGHLMVIFE